MLPDNIERPQLVSAMTPRQYLDAISAPRVDPTAIGEKVLWAKRETPIADESFDESTDAEEHEEDEMNTEVAVQRNIQAVS